MTNERVASAADDLLAACAVVAMTYQTRMYLILNDPKALEQLDAAINKATGKNVSRIMTEDSANWRK